jgi:hypothetical protein
MFLRNKNDSISEAYWAFNWNTYFKKRLLMWDKVSAIWNAVTFYMHGSGGLVVTT